LFLKTGYFYPVFQNTSFAAVFAGGFAVVLLPVSSLSARQSTRTHFTKNQKTMSNSSPITIPCQMLAASGCAYSISGTSYQPPSGDRFGPAIGWTTSGNTPTVITGGIDNEDAALVGTITLAGTTTTAIVVAFEGTVPPALNLDSIIAWYQNIVDEPEYVANLHGSVHSGIYGSVNNVYSAILSTIATLQQQYPDAPLYITGHSKGGGMASLCAAMIYWTASETLQPTAVYTFASPMIGLNDFVTAFPSGIQVNRYENELDMVPFLAASASFISTLEQYAHLDTVVLDAVILMLKETCDEGNFGYVPLGELYFIDGTTISNPSANPGAAQIAQTIAKGYISPSGLEAVLNAHTHTCNSSLPSTYMGGTCNNQGVCTMSN
jgi:hypothetical protein